MKNLTANDLRVNATLGELQGLEAMAKAMVESHGATVVNCDVEERRMGEEVCGKTVHLFVEGVSDSAFSAIVAPFGGVLPLLRGWSFSSNKKKRTLSMRSLARKGPGSELILHLGE